MNLDQCLSTSSRKRFATFEWIYQPKFNGFISFTIFISFLISNQVFAQKCFNPKVSFYLGQSKNPNFLCENDTIQLINTTVDSANSIAKYVWTTSGALNLIKTSNTKDTAYFVFKFRNGFVDTLCKDSVKIFVALEAFDKDSKCGTYTFSTSVKIYFKPRPKFNMSPSPSCVGKRVNFNSATCPAGNTQFLWEIEDSSYSGKNISHVFTKAGKFKIKLKAIKTSPCQSSDSSIQNIDIYNYPVPDFVFKTLRNKNTICDGKDTLLIINKSKNHTSFKWEIMDTLKFKLVKKSKLTSDTVYFVSLDTGFFRVRITARNVVCDSSTEWKFFRAIRSPELKINVPDCINITTINISQYIDSSKGVPDAYQLIISGKNIQDTFYKLSNIKYSNLKYGKYKVRLNSNGICDQFISKDSFFVAPPLSFNYKRDTFCNHVDTLFHLNKFIKSFPTGFCIKWLGDSVRKDSLFNPLNKLKKPYIFFLSDCNSKCYKDTFIINVFSSKPVLFKDSVLCLTHKPFVLQPNFNGIFKGNGIKNNIFKPDSVGVGFHKIIYFSDASVRCSYQDTFIIEITDTIKSNFTINYNDTNCLDSTFHLLNTTKAPTWNWRYSDNSKSDTGKKVNKIFVKTGRYGVQLSVGKLGGCKDSITKFIDVFDKPQFTYTATIAILSCDSAFIRFKVKNPEPLAKYTWDFGALKIKSDSIRYLVKARPSKNPFFLSYTISSTNRCGLISKKDSILIPQKSFADLVLSGPSKSCTPFTPSLTNNSYGKSDSIQIDYGNGIVKNKLTSMTYFNTTKKDTIFKILLRSYDSCGFTKDSISITVAPNLIDTTIILKKLGCLDSLFYFSANDSAVQWNFGDGNLSNSQKPNHQYKKTGIFSIKVLLAAPFNCQALGRSSLRVIDKPSSKIQFSLDSAHCDSNYLRLKLLNADTVNAYKWNIDNKWFTIKYEDTIKIPQKNIRYDLPFFLTSTNKCGSSVIKDSTEIPIQFKAKVAVNGLYKGCSPFTPNILNYSLGHVDSFFVTYGNGDTSKNRIKPLTYYNSTDSIIKYKVILNAFSQFCGGRMDSLYILIEPNIVNPIAKFLDTLYCDGDTIAFINQSSPDADVKFYWGDGTVVNNLKFRDTIHHVYKKPGIYNTRLIAESCGVDTSEYYKLFIDSFPNINFSSSPSTLCEGRRIYFTKTSTNSVTNYWKINGTKFSGADTFSFIFTNPGLYKVELVANSLANKCVASFFKNTTIDTMPTLTFSLAPRIGCAPMRVCAYPKGNFDYFLMDWGINNSYTPSLCNQYPFPGKYNLKYKAGKLNGGCEINGISDVMVIQKPNANYQIQLDTSFCSNVAVFAKITTKDSFNQYSWIINKDTLFGDSIKTTILRDTFRKIEPVKLIIYNACGSKVLTDKLNIPADLKAKSLISVNGLNTACLNLNARFFNYSKGNIDTFKVDYGNGKKSISTNPFIDSTFYTNKTNLILKFPITLTVTNKNKTCPPLSSSTLITIYPDSLLFGEEHWKNAHCVEEELQFVNRSSPGDTVGFDFDDGFISNKIYQFGDTVKHTYKQAGNYKIYALGSNICSVKYRKYLFTDSVLNPPQINFSIDPKVICQDFPITFKNLTPQVKNLKWVINSDTVSSQETFQYRFKTSGSYNISLIAETLKAGCQSQLTKPINVLFPSSYQIMIDTPICVNQTVCVKPSISITKLVINWGNNKFGTLTDSCNRYSSSGPKNLIFDFETTDGCIGKDSQVLMVHNLPLVKTIPDINEITLSIAELLTLEFNTQPYKNFTWYKNDTLICDNTLIGCEKIGVGPYYYKIKDEVYKITLTNQYGCFSSDSIRIKGSETDGFVVPNAFSPNDNSLNEYFKPTFIDPYITHYDMSIFNRWGENVYTATEIKPSDKGWDGKYKNKDSQMGIYAVIIKFYRQNDLYQIYYGEIHLIK